MTSEMPCKYWKNLPEARHIPDLIATADARAREMAARAPTVPPPRAGKIRTRLAAARVATPMPGSVADLRARMAACNRCPLHGPATRLVPGEGPREAALMVVGEQPGAQEDLAGRPFVGPAGQLFDRLVAEAGLDRSAAYVTNAVKHFKFRRAGKRRRHQAPNRDEIEHCKWWL